MSRANSRFALVHIGVLDEHGGLPVAALGHQGRIGVDFLLDAVFFKDFFNPQHLLDLVANRGFAFKLQGDVVAQMHRAHFAVRQHLGLVGLAKFAVSLKAHQVF
jgi:hypothetical protein